MQPEAGSVNVEDLGEDRLLSAAELGPALKGAIGINVAVATLNTQAVRGGGPPFQYLGRRRFYRWGTALAHYRARLSTPVTSTSELARVAA